MKFPSENARSWDIKKHFGTQTQDTALYASDLLASRVLSVETSSPLYMRTRPYAAIFICFMFCDYKWYVGGAG